MTQEFIEEMQDLKLPVPFQAQILKSIKVQKFRVTHFSGNHGFSILCSRKEKSKGWRTLNKSSVTCKRCLKKLS